MPKVEDEDEGVINT